MSLRSNSFLAYVPTIGNMLNDLALLLNHCLISQRKIAKLVWNSDCQHAFDSLKTAHTINQVMALPTSDAEGLIVDVDACNYGIGCVLSQVQDGEERVIAYASRSLKRAERNYGVTNRELLAIKYFVEYILDITSSCDTPQYAQTIYH